MEVATFRSDGNYGDGRRPDSVSFASAQEDAQRRDFTINGLFLDPLDGDRVIDFVNGLADLRSKVLRAIGSPERRFAEDHLRLLRAVRFAARFDLVVEPATAAAIARDAALLKRISPERIADELRLALTPPTRTRAWRLLWEYGLGRTAFRSPPFPPPAAEPGFFFARVAPKESVTFGLALAAGAMELHLAAGGSVHEVVRRKCLQGMAQSLRQCLKISNDECDDMLATLESLGPLLGEPFPGVASLKRFMALPTAGNTRRLLEALGRIDEHRVRVADRGPRRVELEGVDCAPLPLLTGDDLLAAGLSPGPAFKRILQTVYDAQLEARIESKAAGLSMALALAGHEQADHPGQG